VERAAADVALLALPGVAVEAIPDVAEGGVSVILTFHTLDEKPAADAFSPQLFARGMTVLREHGYRTIGLADLVDRLTHGGGFPDRSFVLTFDDGYQSVYEHARPLLESFGWTATVFLTVGDASGGKSSGRLPRLSGRPMLSWREIEDLQRVGVTFGAHTLTHPDLTRLPASRVETEVARSKAVIEERLGTAVTAFAYPFGRYDATTREVVRRHFDCACSDRLGIVQPGSDLHALERVDAHYLRDERLFATIPTRWFPLYIRARAAPRRLRRAVSRGRTVR
jgi:peptidoglycan/xylan/chitin deacetylase (PgdA/CDA1 family)